MRLAAKRTRAVNGFGAGLDVSSLLGQAGGALAKTVTIRTNATPDIVIDIEQAMGPGSSPVLAALKPMIVLDGGALGRQVIAPYGEPSEAGSFVGPGVLLGLFGLGFMIGRLTKR